MPNRKLAVERERERQEDALSRVHSFPFLIFVKGNSTDSFRCEGSGREAELKEGRRASHRQKSARPERWNHDNRNLILVLISYGFSSSGRGFAYRVRPRGARLCV